jgi:predicted DNA-binding transcriptional regulator YafY
MARNEQLIRQHKLLQILERYRFGRTLEEIRDELVEELGLTSLHTRSVRRDIEALQAAGFHIEQAEIARGKVWKLGVGVRGAHKISASATELLALSLGRDLLYPLSGTPFWHGIESFWHKIKETLPEAIWEHYEKFRHTLLVRGAPAKSYQQHQGMLKTVQRAILEHRVVEIEYQRLGQQEPRKRQIEPLAVVFYQSSLYIVAADHQSQADDPVRHFKLDRFRKATALDAWFKPPADFDAQQHWGESLGMFSGGTLQEFRIRVSAYGAPWVREDPWSAQQSLEPQDDGSVILTVKAAHDMEIIPRVLALGAEAEVLSPASCREAIGKIVQQLASVYEK